MQTHQVLPCSRQSWHCWQYPRFHWSLQAFWSFLRSELHVCQEWITSERLHGMLLMCRNVGQKWCATSPTSAGRFPWRAGWGNSLTFWPAFWCRCWLGGAIGLPPRLLARTDWNAIPPESAGVYQETELQHGGHVSVLACLCGVSQQQMVTEDSAVQVVSRVRNPNGIGNCAVKAMLLVLFCSQSNSERCVHPGGPDPSDLHHGKVTTRLRWLHARRVRGNIS